MFYIKINFSKRWLRISCLVMFLQKLSPTVNFLPQNPVFKISLCRLGVK